MNHRFGVLGLVAATGVALASAPAPAAAQAFTPPQGLFTFSLTSQYVNNTGHLLPDGSLFRQGDSRDFGILLEGSYAVTDRLAVSLGIPYIFAKYTGTIEFPVFRAVDTCHCWHSSFQDFIFVSQYRLGDRTFAITPSLGFVLPSHSYSFRGEAVVGRDLKELNLGIAAGYVLRGPLAGTVLQGNYTYSFVERVLDIPNNRSNATVDVGHSLGPKLYLHAFANWQQTHGGLHFGPPGMPNDVCPCNTANPSETPKFDQHDRLLRNNYWHAGGGLAYAFEHVDVFLSVTDFVSGTDTHAGQSYAVGFSYYFGGPASR
jgi:hypothetical protein